MKVETPIALPNGRFTKTSGYPFHKFGLVLHASVSGKGWCLTSPQSGLLVAKGNSKKQCLDAFQQLTEQFSKEQVLERIEAAPAAPPLDSIEPHTKPLAPRRIARETLGQIVKAIADRAGLNDSETEAVWRALATNGRNAGRLLSKPPSRQVDELANAAWNGLQPNPWKVQTTTLFFLDGNAKDLLYKLVKHPWPAYLDRDASTLKALNVW
jgi:hypothetical protein